MSKESNVVPIKPEQGAVAEFSPEEEKLAEIYETRDRRELRALVKQKARHKKATPLPRLKVTRKDDRDHIDIDHPSLAAGMALLMESVGTSNYVHGRFTCEALALRAEIAELVRASRLHAATL